jgi:hypothetical protein
MLALGAYALANRPPQAPGDDIIIKGGSMTIECGSNHGKDCLAHTSGTYLYSHKKNAHIMHVLATGSDGAVLLDQDFTNNGQPTIKVTYK